MADLQTPFTDAVAPVQSGAASGSGGTSGGWDFPDGKSESPNSVSGLPPLVTTVSLGANDPGVHTQVPMPPVASPGTIPTGGGE